MNEQALFRIERSIVVRARRSTVFRYFTDSERFASWWGAGSSIEPKPGGRVHICYPGGVTAGGEVVELERDERIAFTYGYDDHQKPIARGTTRVTITLTDHAEGTKLFFVHELADAKARDEHVAGWRFQLSLFANVVAREEHAGLDALVDRYFAAWAEANPTEREKHLAGAVTDAVSFHDAFACIHGRAELALHIEASRRHLGALTLRRDGASRQCQGTALVSWIATDEGGTAKARGTNVLTLAPDGLIAGIVGFSPER